MGAQFSKTAANGETAVEKPGEAAASPTKTNGQVIAFVKGNICIPLVCVKVLSALLWALMETHAGLLEQTTTMGKH